MTQIHTNKFHEHVPSKPTTTSMRRKGIDKYANAQTTMKSQQSSRKIIQLHQRFLDYFCWTIKGKTKHATNSKNSVSLV